MRLMRDLVGEILSGRYRLLARVAGGGMGEVYRGHDLLLERAVAVKVLQPSLASDPELVARFRQEARAAARLTHPNVVAVYDWGSEGEGTYYMVMEFVSGTDLRDLMVGNGVLKPAHAAAIVAAVCDALHAAHSTGLVHRDVKPENILIARDGTVKVADFGIAVVADADRTSPGGGIPGTLRYLSPEQARGLDATPASDIWAAGAVLAEALTGRPPLLGSGGDLLQRRAVETPVAPSRFDGRVPRELDAVVLTACAVDPSERHRDAAEMGAALRRVAARWLPDAPPLDSLMDELTGEIRLPDMEATMFSRKGVTRRKRSLRARAARAAVVLGLIAALAFGGAETLPALLGPREVRVPKLVGLSAEEAVGRAHAEGLVAEVLERRKHMTVPEGEIFGQVPSGGTVEEGSIVRLLVSAGLPSHRVPAVVGLNLEQARKRLRARGLRVGKVTRRFSDHRAGTIIKQRPAGGRLEWGSKVRLVQSRGPRPVEVPELIGLPEADATARLEELGFTVVVVEVNHDEVEAGKVVATDPAAGTTAPEGSGVQITVSLGPKLRSFKMPDVRGMNVNAARSKLEGLGLVVNVVRSCPGKTVVDTDPIGGQKVTERDEVALFVC